MRKPVNGEKLMNSSCDRSRQEDLQNMIFQTEDLFVSPELVKIVDKIFFFNIAGTVQNSISIKGRFIQNIIQTSLVQNFIFTGRPDLVQAVKTCQDDQVSSVLSADTFLMLAPDHGSAYFKNEIIPGRTE